MLGEFLGDLRDCDYSALVSASSRNSFHFALHHQLIESPSLIIFDPYPDFVYIFLLFSIAV